MIVEFPQEMLDTFNGAYEDMLLILHGRNNQATHGAYFWDSFISDGNGMNHWKNVTYMWIASSLYGDQICLVENSPIHDNSQGIYMFGPDIAGPRSKNPAWPDNMLYLGDSIPLWIDRIQQFGDEHSIGPGGISRELGNRADEYKSIYRKLNPGLTW